MVQTVAEYVTVRQLIEHTGSNYAIVDVLPAFFVLLLIQLTHIDPVENGVGLLLILLKGSKSCSTLPSLLYSKL